MRVRKCLKGWGKEKPSRRDRHGRVRLTHGPTQKRPRKAFQRRRINAAHHDEQRAPPDARKHWRGTASALKHLAGRPLPPFDGLQEFGAMCTSSCSAGNTHGRRRARPPEARREPTVPTSAPSHIDCKSLHRLGHGTLAEERGQPRPERRYKYQVISF
jgi:hypothetical protein